MTLILVSGGASLITPGAPLSAALAPANATAGLHPALLWMPLAITSFAATPSPAFLNGAATIAVNVTGGQTPYTYNYSGLPPGCSGGNSSSLSCTPSTVGNYTIVVRVSDAGGNATRNAIKLRTVGMTITSFTESTSTLSLGSPVTFTGAGAGAIGAVTWAWSGLPAGCASTNSFTLTCTPTATGTFNVKLNATDTSGAYNTQVVVLTVTPVSIAGFTDSPASIHTGQTTTFTTTATGTSAWVKYTYTGLPPGSSTCLSQNKSSWSCVPRETGTFTVRVYANDSAGNSATRTVVLTVAGLAITSFLAAPSPSYELLATTFTVSAVGFLGPVVGGVPQTPYAIYSYTGLPSGCASANLSRLVCRASSTGTFAVTANVSDPTGNYTTSTLTLTIFPAVLPDFYVVEDGAVQTQTQPTGGEPCVTQNASPFFQSTCKPQAQDPSVVPLPSGMTGLAYTLYTTSTTNTCWPGASADTVARVMFALSSNNGTSFGTPVNLGPTSCGYLNAIEPSFASNSAGDVYGVFVMENNSSTPNNYGIRSADAFGFVASTNGGVSFSAVTTISAAGAANLARPEIAVIGSTIYLVYEDLSNGSSVLPGAPSSANPISVEFTVSSNGGTSWTTPVTLPGINGTNGYNAMSPSIAVSKTGEVAVAYATDRSCINHVGAPSTTACLNYGSEVVAVTSTNNGTSWSAPSVASRGMPENPLKGLVGAFVGETTCDTGTCQSYLFQSTPETAVAFSPSGSDLVVGWAGTINNTVTLNPAYQWRWTAVGVSASSNNGASWTGGIVAGPDAGTSTTSTGNRSNYYRPAIGVTGTELYLTYSEDNETNTSSGVGFQYPGPFDNSLSQWGDEAALSTGSSGLTLAWGVAAPIQLVSIPAGRDTNVTGNSFTGFASSVGFNAQGEPLVAYAIAQMPVSSVVSRPGYYALNTSYGTSLVVGALAEVGTAEVTTVSITETGLAPGTTWSLTMDGQLVSSNGTSLLVANVPLGVAIYENLLPPQLGSTWGIQVSAPYLPPSATYNASGTIELAYSLLLYYNQSTQPTLNPTLPIFPSCNPKFTYCDWETFTDFEIYECLPVPGYTCSTAPATSSYSVQCDPTSQVGCYYLSAFLDNFTEIGPAFFIYDVETDEYLYTFSATQGYVQVPLSPAGELQSFCEDFGTTPNWPPTCTFHGQAAGTPAPCNASTPLAAVAATCYASWQAGLWLPGGFEISSGYGGGDFYTNMLASATAYPDYFNGTGAQAFNGTFSDTCLDLVDCPIAYYSYYYNAILDPFVCSLAQTSFNFGCTGSAEPVVMVGPVNETLWQIPPSNSGPSPGFPLDVAPKGLPNGAPYSFVVAGRKYSAVSPNPVLVDSVPVGLDPITRAIAASPTKPGWDYFGDPVTVSVPSTVIVNLTFVDFANLSAPARSVAITGGNLSNGVPWAVEFNGTRYQASTPTISVSVHPGYYGIGSWAVNSTDGQTRYVPTNPTGIVDLTSATKYTLPFTPWYRTVVTASAGGLIQVGAGKLVGSSDAYYPSGRSLELNATASAGYEFLGFSGSGLGSYTGNGTGTGSVHSATITVNAPIEEGVAFESAPSARYSATFLSTGLPAGVWWTISLSGVSYSTNQPSLTVTGLYPSSSPSGNYQLIVNDAYGASSGGGGTRFVPGSYPLSFGVSATGVTDVQLNWTTQYLVTIAATAGGSVLGTYGATSLGAGTYWEPTGLAINLTATPIAPSSGSLGYRFVGWEGMGSGATSATSKSIVFYTNSSVTELAQFAARTYTPPPEYTVTFTEGAFPSGTAWSLVVKNQTETRHFSSEGRDLNATGLTNFSSYTLTVSVAYAGNATERFVPTAPATFAVAGKNASIAIPFTNQYWVSVRASNYGAAAVSEKSTPVDLSGWFAPATELTLNATAAGNAVFVAWSGTGKGNYSGAAASWTITVNGPIDEVAQFAPVAPPAVQKAGFLGSTMGWAVLGAVGLAAGLGGGYAVMRARRGGPASEEDAGSIQEQEPGFGEDLSHDASREGEPPEGSGMSAGPEEDPGAGYGGPGGDQ